MRILIFDSMSRAKLRKYILNPDVTKLDEVTKKALYSRIYKANGDPVLSVKFSKVNDILKDYSLKVRDPHMIADMMLYFLNLACDYARKYYHGESFVKSLVANFRKLSSLRISNGMEDEYAEQMLKLVEKTYHIGYWCTDCVHDAVDESFMP